MERWHRGTAARMTPSTAGPCWDLGGWAAAAVAVAVAGGGQRATIEALDVPVGCARADRVERRDRECHGPIRRPGTAAAVQHGCDPQHERVPESNAAAPLPESSRSSNDWRRRVAPACAWRATGITPPAMGAPGIASSGEAIRKRRTPAEAGVLPGTSCARADADGGAGLTSVHRFGQRDAGERLVRTHLDVIGGGRRRRERAAFVVAGEVGAAAVGAGGRRSAGPHVQVRVTGAA